MGAGRPVPPAPTEEDSEAAKLPAPVFLFTFTAIGMTTVEASRVHVRIRATTVREAQNLP